MTPVPPSGKIFGRFLALIAALVAALAAVGYLPTERLGGERATIAMLVGCAIALVASVLGTVPVWLARGRGHAELIPTVFLAMGMRLGAALALGIGVALSGMLPIKPLLVWLLIAHGVLIVPDTLFGIKVLSQ